MKRSQESANVTELVQALPENAQAVVMGGVSDSFPELEGIQGERTSASGIVVPIKVKHNL